MRSVCLSVFALMFLIIPGTGHAIDQDNLQKASVLNDSAAAKMKAGDIDGAERDLQKALAFSNEHARVRKNLAVVYYEKGMRELGRKNDIFEAKRYFRMALDIDPDKIPFKKGYSIVLFLEAENSSNKGSSGEALRLYKEAAQWDPSNFSAWIKAAHYAWKTQNLDLARNYLEKAKAIKPNDKNISILESKLASGENESRLETNCSEHFILAADTVYFNEVGAHNILEHLERGYQQVNYKLRFHTKIKLTVVFYSAKEFHENLNLSGHVYGYYDGKLRLPYFSGDMLKGEVQPIVLHELSHAFVDQISGRPLPQWLEEGIAQWVEGRVLEGNTKEALVSYENAEQSPAIKDLDQSLKNGDTIAYVKAFSVVEYIIDQKGVRSLVALIEDYGTGLLIDELFKRYYYIALDDVEEKWREWLKRT